MIMWIAVWLVTGWSLGVISVRQFDAWQVRRYKKRRAQPRIVDGSVVARPSADLSIVTAPRTYQPEKS